MSIEAPAACPIFASRVIRGVNTGVGTPQWLKERLRRVGINSISPIVDVTNYVMMELGQPMHAYDLARIDGSIRVRTAKPGERVTLLDDKEYSLDPEYLVIATPAEPSGSRASWADAVRRSAIRPPMYYWSRAHFSPDAIAGRARQLGLFTDAAHRFERGVDPGLAGVAIERASAPAAADRGRRSRTRAADAGRHRARGGGRPRGRVGELADAAAWRACSEWPCPTRKSSPCCRR